MMLSHSKMSLPKIDAVRRRLARIAFPSACTSGDKHLSVTVTWLYGKQCENY